MDNNIFCRVFDYNIPRWSVRPFRPSSLSPTHYCVVLFHTPIPLHAINER